MLKKDLIKIVRNRSEELIDLVSSLIKIPSENPVGTMDEVVLFVKNYLEDAGITYREVFTNEKFPVLIASLGENNNNKILLNGHIDVVPVGDLKQWHFDPFSGEVEAGKILGRGTSDMKAGVAGQLFAMKIIKESYLDFDGMIEFHIVTDEESGGEYGTKWLMDEGYFDNAKACIIAEPTSNNNIEVGQKGSLDINIRTIGVSAHGSLANYAGENAIEKMMLVLSNISDIKNLKGKYKNSQLKVLADSKAIAKKALKVTGSENVIDHVSLNVGLINGGIRTNMVPDNCEVAINCRLPIGITCLEVEKKTKEIIDSLNISGVELEFRHNSEGNYTDADSDLVQSIKTNAEYIWGNEITPAYQWASSDARYYRYKDVPTIQFGPANLAGIHSYNEDVDVEDVIKSTQVYVATLIDLLTADR